MSSRWGNPKKRASFISAEGLTGRMESNLPITEDHGIGLEFNDKEQLAEFFYKARELYPDSFLQTDTIFVSGNRVITEWTLQFTLTEPFYGGLKRTVKVSVHGASIVRIEHGKIAVWADYYDGLTSRRTALGSHFTEWIEL